MKCKQGQRAKQKHSQHVRARIATWKRVPRVALPWFKFNMQDGYQVPLALRKRRRIEREGGRKREQTALDKESALASITEGCGCSCCSCRWSYANTLPIVIGAIWKYCLYRHGQIIVWHCTIQRGKQIGYGSRHTVTQASQLAQYPVNDSCQKFYNSKSTGLRQVIDHAFTAIAYTDT